MHIGYIEDGVCKSRCETVKFDIETDILVAGIGTAGSIAALAAAREGASVIAFDRAASAGGLGTGGCVWDYYYGIPGGTADEINCECAKIEKGGYAGTQNGAEFNSFSAAVRTAVLEDKLISAGCRLFLKTVPLGVYMEGTKVVGALLFVGGRKISVGCRVLLDCTGDVFMVRMAGGRVVPGRKTDGKFLISSNTATVLRNGRLVNVWDHCSIENTSNSKGFSEVVLESAVKPPILFERYDEESRVICFSSVLGERGAPRIEADETLTLAAYADGYRVEKPLFYAFSQVDDVNFDIANSDDINQDWRLISALYFYGISLGVSLGTLLPKGLDGIAAACRGVGVDYDLLGCVRMRRNMEKYGAAAGVAAAFAVKTGKNLRELDVDMLRKRLADIGCLCEGDNIGIGDLKKPHWKSYESVGLPQTLDEIKNGLKAAQPHLAFWAVRTSAAKGLADGIFAWCADGSKTFRENSFVALGLLGDRRALPQLSKIVEDGPETPGAPVRDAFCYQPYTAALCILGRLGGMAEARVLMNAAERAEAYAKAMPIAGNAYFKTMGDWKFIFFSLAAAAVLKIAKREKTGEFDAWLKSCADEKKYPSECRGGLYRSSLSGLIGKYFSEKEGEII